MSVPRRGEIWLADFGIPVGREQGLRRPALIVSGDRVNAGAGGVVIVIPITSRGRGMPLHVEIDSAESGLDLTSYVRCEDIRSVSMERLIVKLGGAPVDAMFRVEQVMRWVLGLA